MAQGKRANIYYQAQALLSKRDHSAYEVRTKLARRGFSADHIESVIQRLQKEKLIDDIRFAEVFIESVLNNKAVGPRWLHAKLRQRGISSSLIQEKLAAYVDREHELELMHRATEIWRRHEKKNSDPRRLTRFLLARGFSSSTVVEYLEGLKDNEQVF